MYKYNLTVIIVSWNVKDRLRENLLALRASSHDISFETFVVDNNSNDGTAQMIRLNFPEINLIANSNNLGFAKANNQAIKIAQGEHILLLNPDMKILPDTLVKMNSWFNSHPQAAVAGCKLEDENRNTIPHVRRFPQFSDQLAIIFKLPHLFPEILNKYLATDFDYNLPAKVDSVRGSFFLMRRDNNMAQLLDERYFVWFEEVDYCRQVRSRGLEVWYTPIATCIDYVGGSFKQLKRGKSQNYFRKSMLAYFQKWHPGWQYNVLRIAWPIGYLLATVADKLKLKSRAKT